MQVPCRVTSSLAAKPLLILLRRLFTETAGTPPEKMDIVRNTTQRGLHPGLDSSAFPFVCSSRAQESARDNCGFPDSYRRPAVHSAKMSAGDDLVKDAFRKAKRSFRDSLPDRKLYNEINRETTAEDVYDLLKKLQEDAASRGDMRYMAKIRPFIERLREYGPTLDTFCSAKPDILALIWGPIRFIIQWASQFYKILDSIADATVRIAVALPHFTAIMQVFPRSDTIKLALVLFYQNILDFYAAILQYHKKRGIRLSQG